ncbi:hypothetical protein V5O48_019681, partial [Marasmius crinis-equi]
IDDIVNSHVTYTAADRPKFKKIRFWVRENFKDGTSTGDAIVVEEVQESGPGADIADEAEESESDDEEGSAES